MPFLKNCEVFRGGSTRTRLGFATQFCGFKFDITTKKLKFDFSISSAGGGNSEILLQIGMDDLPLILEGVARNAPESAKLFSECAKIARKKHLEQIEAAKHAAERARDEANTLISQIQTELEEIQEFVSDKFHEALAGEDERESMMNDKISGIKRSIRLHLFSRRK